MVSNQPLPPPTPHRQPLFHIQPVDPLHVDRVPAPFQHRVKAPVAEARLLPGQLHQLSPQLDVAIRPGFVTITRSIHSKQLAGGALAQPEPGLSERYILSQTGKLHPFFRITAFSTS